MPVGASMVERSGGGFEGVGEQRGSGMDFVFHIGCHKCASTALQRLFRESGAVDYRFVSGSDPRRGKREVLDELESESPRFEWLRKELLKGFSGERPVVLSHEELSGDISGKANPDWRVVAGNLKELIPEARILIVVRRQTDYIRSLYAFRVGIKGEETRSFGRFVSEEGAAGLFDKLDYSVLVKRHVELFGSERVFVLPMEWLSRDRKRFAAALSEAVGADFAEDAFPAPSNASPKNASVLALCRFCNLLFSAVYAPIGWVFPYRVSSKFRFAYYASKRVLVPALARIVPGRGLDNPSVPDDVVSRWSAGNAELSRLFDLDLKDLGYP